MSATAVSAKPRGLALMLGWRRLRFTLSFSIGLGLLLGLTTWASGVMSVLIRTVLLGLIAMLVFGLFEQWPKRLPRWLARWVLQVTGVALAMPPSTAIIYWLSTSPGAPPFYHVQDRMEGFATLTVLGLLASAGDVRMMRSGTPRGAPRIGRHLWRMSFALFIATMSFFLGQQDELPKALRIPALLALPVLAVLVTMLYWVWRVRIRRSLRGIMAVSAPEAI